MLRQVYSVLGAKCDYTFMHKSKAGAKLRKKNDICKYFGTFFSEKCRILIFIMQNFHFFVCGRGVLDGLKGVCGLLEKEIEGLGFLKNGTVIYIILCII